MSFPAALAAALVKAQSEMKPAPKDNTNPAFKSRYADLATVVETVRPVLAKHGLGFLQPVATNDDGTVTVSTVIIHTSGETWTSPGVTLRPGKGDAQGIGSAITYARRYDLCSAFGIVADDDDDANAASGVSGKRHSPAPQPPREEPRPINVEALRAECARRGVEFSHLEAEVEKPAADWTPADREAIAAALGRLSPR